MKDEVKAKPAVASRVDVFTPVRNPLGLARPCRTASRGSILVCR